MKIKFEQLKEILKISHQEKFDFSANKINDALLKKINWAEVNLMAFLVDETDISINIKINYNIDYLDARNLEPLVLNFKIDDQILLTTDLQKAKELDLDHFTDEIDVEQLIWELIIINVPFNYSKAQPLTASHDDSDVINFPFANAFKKSKEE